MTTPTSTTGNSPVKPTWEEQKTKIKAKFPNVTDTDLHFEEGKKGEMYAKLQTKLGKTKEELQTAIAAL